MYSWRPNGVLLFVSQGQDFSMQKTSSQVSDGGGVSWYIMCPWLLIMTQTIKAIKAVDTCHNFGIVFHFFSFNLPRPHPYPPKKESCDCHKWQQKIKMPPFCKHTCCLLDIWLVPGRRSLWGGGDAGKVGPRGMAPWTGLAKRMEVEARLKGDSQMPPTVLFDHCHNWK